MKKSYLVVANWKMNISFKESLEFLELFSDDLIEVATKTSQSIILCPSFIALYPFSLSFKDTPIALGAQDCSPYRRGNFTGQVSAQCIQEAGCSYCIIGHSERRRYSQETNEEIIKKFIHLFEYGVSPIICIGESDEEYRSKNTFTILKAQLEPLLQYLKENNSNIKNNAPLSISIAYEPIGAIGTGNLPSHDHLETVFAWLKECTLSFSGITWKLLYGGSVNTYTIDVLKHIPSIDGFLIGGASTRFEELKAIIENVTH